jgi:hypothetical protein
MMSDWLVQPIELGLFIAQVDPEDLGLSVGAIRCWTSACGPEATEFLGHTTTRQILLRG